MAVEPGVQGTAMPPTLATLPQKPATTSAAVTLPQKPATDITLLQGPGVQTFGGFPGGVAVASGGVADSRTDEWLAGYHQGYQEGFQATDPKLNQ